MSKQDKLIKIASEYDENYNPGDRQKLHSLIQFSIESVKGTKNEITLQELLKRMKNNNDGIHWDAYIHILQESIDNRTD